MTSRPMRKEVVPFWRRGRSIRRHGLAELALQARSHISAALHALCGCFALPQLGQSVVWTDFKAW